jgi:hypothetical protein
MAVIVEQVTAARWFHILALTIRTCVVQAKLLSHVHTFADSYAHLLAPHAATDATVKATLHSLLGCISRDDATCNPNPPKAGGGGTAGVAGQQQQQQHVHERLAFVATFLCCCLGAEPALPLGLLTAAFLSLSNGWSMLERSLRSAERRAMCHHAVHCASTACMTCGKSCKFACPHVRLDRRCPPIITRCENPAQAELSQ